MANRNEFQPDKVKLGILDRLHLTRQQRKHLLRWVLYSLVLLILSLVQDVILCRYRIWGATTDLVPCAILLIVLLEGMEHGCIFALCASCLYFFSVSVPGIYAMVILTFLAICTAWFRQAHLRGNFPNAVLCTVPALLLYELLIWVFGLFLGQTYPARILGFLITAGLTSLVIPILYPLFCRIASIGGEPWKE